jgi:hypothetical protein
MKTPTLTATLKGAVERAGLNGKALANLTGIPYQTLRYRYKYPSTWRFCEWGAVMRHVTLNESEQEI